MGFELHSTSNVALPVLWWMHCLRLHFGKPKRPNLPCYNSMREAAKPLSNQFGLNLGQVAVD
eukprot:290146-Amphidinium_carterae.1